MKFFTILSNNKITTGIIVIMLASGSYYFYNKSKSKNLPIQYTTGKVIKSTLSTNVSGTGQISSSNQIDIKFTGSGKVTNINVQSAQEVKAGQLIAQIDSSDVRKAIRDAEVNLESAELSLKKLQQPADLLSLTQAENNLEKAKESKQDAEDNLNKNYETAFNNISNAFIDLPDAITGLQNILYGTSGDAGSAGQWYIDYYASTAGRFDSSTNKYKTDAGDKYQLARTAFDKNFSDYKNTNRNSSPAEIETLIDETYQTTKSLAEAIKSANNLIQFYKDILTQRSAKTASFTDTHLASLNSYTGKINSHLLNMISSQSSLKTEKDNIANAIRTIEENTQSLNKLKAGAEDLDIESAKLTVKQRQNALQDAREKYSDYSAYAPFDGTIAKINIKKYDSVSGGTAIATLIAKQKIAEISLNEVDVAKVKVGQKVLLTFDAISDLETTGVVGEINSLGTATQGVVYYSVKIIFDTQDDRILPGMSVSANIITNSKIDVLMVPNSSIKTQGNTKYVEILENGIPKSLTVETGISNDSFTEIVSGLKENDEIITQTVNPNKTTTQTTGASILGGNALRGVGR
jgi:HlyD family secretion protein